MSQHDPVQSPSHYRGASGIQSIAITHAYRLGPDLTQAVDYILRAGRKTSDPRQDLGKAAFYLRYAGKHARDLVFGLPTETRPTPSEITADFDLDAYRALALAEVLAPHPTPDRLLVAAGLLDRASDAWSRAQMPAANTGRAA